jgi:AcrR family transcriptional regulator
MAAPPIPSSERILLKALDLFASKGYEGTSVREICEAAEITKPTL